MDAKQLCLIPGNAQDKGLTIHVHTIVVVGDAASQLGDPYIRGILPHLNAGDGLFNRSMCHR
jgi:hypothetical protein